MNSTCASWQLIQTSSPFSTLTPFAANKEAYSFNLANSINFTQPRASRFDDFILEKKIRDLKTNIKPFPSKSIYNNPNTLNDRRELKYESLYFQNNNKQKFDGIKDLSNSVYIENRSSKFYSVKTNPIPKSNFIYSTNTHNYSNSGIQSPNRINNDIPKYSRIQTETNYNNYNNDTLLNNYQYENYEKSNYSNQTDFNYNNNPENNQAMNNIQNLDNFQLIGDHNNYNYNNEPDKGQTMNNIQNYDSLQSIDNNNDINANYNLNSQLMSESDNNSLYLKDYITINNIYSNHNKNIQDVDNTFINNNNVNNQIQKDIEDKNNEYLNNSPQFKINQKNDIDINPLLKSAYFQNTTLQLNNEEVSKNNYFNNHQTKDDNFIESNNLNLNFNSPQNENVSNEENAPEIKDDQETEERKDSNDLPNDDLTRSESKEEKDEKIKDSMLNLYMENDEIISNSNAKEYYRESNGLVKSYAYFQDQNVGNRNYMEDQGKVVENLEGDPNKILFCLFDGHGGGEVSKFLQENFHKYLKNYLPFKNYYRGFYDLFKFLDEEIKMLNVPQVGSTATIAYIERKNGKKVLYCVNVGDSRCVLINKKRIMRMSYDDRVEDPKEKKRILQQGGVIYSGRIYGSLMLSRSFGDWIIKSYGVIVDPHITKIELTDDDQYLIIASDGLWDAIKDEECRRLCETNTNTLEICKNFVVESLKRGSQDNISCFIIRLK